MKFSRLPAMFLYLAFQIRTSYFMSKPFTFATGKTLINQISMYLIFDFGHSSTTGVSFVPEQLPDGLFIDFQYTSGGIMSKYDVWRAITGSIANIALLNWNREIVGLLTTQVTPNVEVRFVSSVNPPRYQSKTIIWTLAEVFEHYNSQRQYSSYFLRTRVGRGPAMQNLGIASIRSTLSTPPSLQTDSSALSLANNTSLLELNSSTLALGTSSAQAQFNQSLVSLPESSISQSDSQRTSSLQAGEISLFLQYLKPAATISDKGFFTSIIDTLVFAAQHDPKDAP